MSEAAALALFFFTHTNIHAPTERPLIGCWTAMNGGEQMSLFERPTAAVVAVAVTTAGLWTNHRTLN